MRDVENKETVGGGGKTDTDDRSFKPRRVLESSTLDEVGITSRCLVTS